MVRADFRLKITKVYPAGDLTAQITPSMRNLGNAIGRRAQRLVPKRTWALHDSIFTTTEATDTKVTTIVGFGTSYGVHVERGTSRQRAQPFMRPALLQSKGADFKSGATLASHGIVAPSSSRTRRRTRGRYRAV